MVVEGGLEVDGGLDVVELGGREVSGGWEVLVGVAVDDICGGVEEGTGGEDDCI